MLGIIILGMQIANLQKIWNNIILIHYAQLYDAVMNCASYMYDTRRAQTHRPFFKQWAMA